MLGGTGACFPGKKDKDGAISKVYYYQPKNRIMNKHVSAKKMNTFTFYKGGGSGGSGGNSPPPPPPRSQRNVKNGGKEKEKIEPNERRLFL